MYAEEHVSSSVIVELLSKENVYFYNNTLDSLTKPVQDTRFPFAVSVVRAIPAHFTRLLLRGSRSSISLICSHFTHTDTHPVMWPLYSHFTDITTHRGTLSPIVKVISHEVWFSVVENVALIEHFVPMVAC